MPRGPGRSIWRRLTPRILISTGLAAFFSVAIAASLWTRFFMNEIRLQVARYTEDVVGENVPRCQRAPETFGRRRTIGSFDAYDAATLRSANPTAPPPDPQLVERLRAGEEAPARVDWSWSGALGGAALVQVAPGGSCSLFELRWYAPPGSRGRLLVLLFAITVLTLAGTVALASAVVVRPLVRRLARLCDAAEHVGEDSDLRLDQDRELDDLGELSRILDRAHARIRAESSRLRSRHEVLLAHLEDVAHDLRTPLTAIQIEIEQASGMTEDRECRRLVRSALTDVVYTSEVTENLRLAVRLEASGGTGEPAPAFDLAGVVERAVTRLSLLGKHLGVSVDYAVPLGSLWAVSPLVWAERVVSNLVYDAVTRACDGGHVAVLLEADAVESFRLTVLDDGPEAAGEPIAAPRVWTLRSDARGRGHDGRGLSLALTTEICRRNGWDLHLERRKPGGLRATLRGGSVSAPAALPSDVAGGHPAVTARLPSALSPSLGVDAHPTDPDRERSGSVQATEPPGSRVWRRLASRVMLAAGLAAVASGLLIGGILTRFMVGEILDGVGRYADSVVADVATPCLVSPATWSKVRRVGRLDAYDAATLRSANPSSPPIDEVLRRRLLAGEARPARLFMRRDGQWGGAVLRRVAPEGPCSLFQLSWLSAPGSRGRGLGLLVALTLGAIGITMAVSSVAVVRPLLSRLSRLRRAAALLGSPDGYRPGSDPGDDEIGRLSRILDRTHVRVLAESQQLRERLRQLERHLDDIGHDLRTPLSSAQISLEMVARLPQRPYVTEAIRRALSDVVYASNLAQNLRLLAQLRHGGEPPDRDAVTELTEVVERVVARFNLLGRQRGVRLEGALPRGSLAVRGHPVWTEQALANLAHNAVGHGGPGTNVAVILEAAEGDRFRISVADDGPGVPPGDLSRIAERSFRTDRARRRQPGGAGLGLAITAEICRRSGWSLRFEPQAPRGLRVTIEGPLDGPSPAGSGRVAGDVGRDRRSP